MNDVIKHDQRSEPAPAEVNFALVLSRMIDSLQQDPTQLRQTVYELARVKLREQFGREDINEVNRLVAALETAIHGVEEFSKNEEVRKAQTLPPPPASAEPPASAPEPLVAVPSLASTDTAEDQRRRSARPSPDEFRNDRDLPRKSRPMAIVWRLVLLTSFLVVIGGLVAWWPQLRSNFAAVNGIAAKLTQPPRKAEPTAPAQPPQSETLEAPAPAPSGPGFPLPTTFGIYALSENQLTELKPLPGKVPDQRVAMSAAINSPSQTMVAQGDIKFIVFRRDAATNAPDNAQVRVIAKVARSMGVDSTGKAVKAQVQESWVIRSIAYPYKTGPIEGRPEMYLIQSETPDLVLPPGRYALVIKGQGFDFTVNGPVSDPQQCVERVDAVNGVFYSPCPTK